MDRVFEDLYTWRSFSEEKKLDFNGLYLITAAGVLLIDPPPLSAADIAQVEELGIPKKILLTNKHHTRASAEHRARWGSVLFVHEDDKALMEIPVDGTFADGELLNDVLEAIRIPNSKTPGESAFYWKSRRILIVGDALVGAPPGALRILPDEKFKDPVAARQGLSVLRGLEYDHLMVGDGASILHGAREVVEAFLKQIQSEDQ